jgi:lipid-A-disaccharide synthase
MSSAAQPLDVAIVVGEHSGDQLGASLVRALRSATGGAVRFRGVGGPAMAVEGVSSLFPLADIAVMGITAVVPRLPAILRRIRETVAALSADPPDVLVIIDSPDFTHRVARGLRRARPAVPIVDYVSPSVWAWRPRRARAMRPYVDHLLALLPFEPDVHRRLGGPPTSYVGHPLIQQLDELLPSEAEQAEREASPPTLLVLPGSRAVTVRRLLPVFEETLRRVQANAGPLRVVIPAVDHLAVEVGAATAGWSPKPDIVVGDAAKHAAFRSARAALVCSGTATLELALAQVPMVVAYRVSGLEARFTRFLKVPSIVLPNLVLGENAIPEFLHHTATPGHLAPALAEVLYEGPIRAAQLAALKRLHPLMVIGDEPPADRAARLVLETVAASRGGVSA